MSEPPPPPPTPPSSGDDSVVTPPDGAPPEVSGVGEVPPIGDAPPVQMSPVAEFLQRAGPILAVERGINARSRMKMEIIARELNLPADEFEAAVQSLQRGTADTEEPNAAQVQAFQMVVSKQLENVPGGVLTAAHEEKAIKYAVEHYGIGTEQAVRALKAAVAEKGVQRVSLAEAERYMGDMIAKKLDGSSYIDRPGTELLRNAGKNWGLSGEQVDDLIRQYTEANHKGQLAKRKFATIGIVLGGGLVVLLIAGIAFMTMLPDANDPDDPPADGANPIVGEVKPVTPPNWWDTEVSLAHAQTAHVESDFKPLTAAMSATDNGKRGAAYNDFIQWGMPQLARSGFSVDRFREIIAGSYALDPSDEAAGQLRTSLLNTMLPAGDGLPENGAVYNASFWSLDTALGTLQRAGLSEERSLALTAAIAERLNETAPTGPMDDAERRRMYRALATLLYKKLIAAAPQDAFRAGNLRDALETRAKRYMNLDQHNADFLTAVVPQLGSSWDIQKDLLKKTIASEDPLVVLSVLELYERSKNRDVQSYLADLLLTRVQAVPDSYEVDKIAALVRKKFGASVPIRITAQDRWKRIHDPAVKQLIGRDAFSNNPDTLMQETVSTAHYSTLAAALALDPGFLIFDELVENESPKLNGGSGDGDVDPDMFTPRERTPRISPAEQEQVDSFLKVLRDPSSHPTLKKSAINGISKLAPRVPDLDPSDAGVIAALYMEPRTPENFNQLLTPLREMRKWKQLRLAIGDRLVGCRLPVELIAGLASAALREEITPVTGIQWRHDLRQRLQRQVLSELDAAAPKKDRGGPGGAYNAAESHLLQQYRNRARLFGIPPAQLENFVSVPQALEQIIQRSRTNSAGLKPEDQEFLKRLPRELKVAEYVGGNDLGRTVLLQRIWLRLLALETARRKPEQANRANALVNELVKRDATATDLTHQLKDGETFILSLWMLYEEK